MILTADLMNNLMITIVMQLFILSIISERVTNFIKLNIQSLTERLGNFKDKEDTKEQEKERERGILNWAIVIGILVAIFTKADLFHMVKNNGALPENWVQVNWGGLILTGFFLSLGSKFWHDLLDLLLQVKNLKSKLVDQKDFEFGKIEEVDEFMATVETDLAKKVIAERYNELLGINGIVGVVIKSDSQGIYCEVAVTNNNVVLPQNYVYNYPPGRIKFLRLKKLLTTEIRTMALKPKPQPGEEIGIVATTISGTLGCLVYQASSPLWLTCYHVVKSPAQNWEGYDPIRQIDKVENPDKKPNNEVVIIGRVKEATRNLLLDIALITPDTDVVDINANILGIDTSIKLYREVIEADENVTHVRKFGTTTGLTHGIIDKIAYTALINYSDQQPYKLFNLIRIKNLNISKPFSRPGDSGALVVDSSNQAIGVVVAGSDDGEYSFAIPILSIFNQFNLKFIPESK